MRSEIKRARSRAAAVAVLAVGLLLGAADRARAGALNPLDFTSLGAFPNAAWYTINTSGTPTMTDIFGTTYTGVVYDGIAVFDFDSITINPALPDLSPFPGVLTITGSLPVALLSRTDVTILGTIDGSGQSLPSSGNGPPVGAPGGPGGGSGAAFGLNYGPAGAGGGGFGGPGGAGAPASTGQPGGGGGGAYANLAQQLQGGSGGGTAGANSFGGGGGGGIEIGAVGSLVISGSITVNGGSPPGGAAYGFGGGGGSGGGLFLHADSVQLSGTLSAAGGDGQAGGAFPGGTSRPISAGGGGGGGEVTILGDFSEGSGALIDVAGGAGGSPGISGGAGGAGGAGLIEINGSIVPEPASLVLMVTGLLGPAGCAWLRRKPSPNRRDDRA